MRTLAADDIPGLTNLDGMLRAASRATDPSTMLATLNPWFRRQERSDYFISVSRRGLPEGTYKITRALDRDEQLNADRSTINPWRDWSKIPALSGGLIGDLIARDQPTLTLDLDVPDDPVLGVAIKRMRAALAIPTYDNGCALNWALFFREDPGGWSHDEITQIMGDTNTLGLATKNLVERGRADELNRRLQDQLERVAHVQRALLPARLPSITGYTLATSYLTSDDAGGDYYDFFNLPDGRVGLLIADVAGHGAAAATVMAMLRAILHGYERLDTSPAAVIAYANDRLLDAGLEGSFTTAFFAALDPTTGSLTYTRAGHNPPRVLRANDGLDTLEDAGGLPLGISQTAYEEHTTTLHPGDVLILYTDGITEAFAPLTAINTRELFGEARLDAAALASDRTPQGVVDAVHAALYEHVKAMTRDDDQTLVVLRREPDA